MPYIPEEIVEEIKERADITDIVSPYVHLTKKSGDNLFGLCPFHQEKTPSFSVSTTKQIFYCFGCHKGGDAVTFLMEIEGFTYPEALRYLADKLGITIPTEDTASMRDNRNLRKRQIELQTEAARYFYRVLQSPQGKPARDYLAQRGISVKTSINFGLGYASDSWDGLLKHLRAKGFKDRDLAESGLFRKNKRGNFYDLFRNRLMFPIIDSVGRVIAFGGRILSDEQPKYLNSPETRVYHKGHELYALNLAKKSHDDYFLLVEGYMDVLALHQAGFKQAIACLGTALTPDQAGKIARYRHQIILAFDADTAGRQATERSLDVVRDKGLDAFVLEIPDGLDPDDFISKYGAERFGALLEKPLRATDYKINKAKEESVVLGELDLMLYKDKVLDILRELDDKVEVELRLKRLADEIMVSQDLLAEQLRARGRRKPQRRGQGPSEQDDDQVLALQEELVRDPLSFTIYAMLALFTEERPQLYPKTIRVEDFPKSHHAVAEKILQEAKEGKLNERRLVDLLRPYRVGDTPAASLIAAQLLEIQPPRDERQAKASLAMSLRRLKRDRVQEAIAETNFALQEAAHKGNDEEIIHLEKTLQELLERQRKLRQGDIR